MTCTLKSTDAAHNFKEHSVGNIMLQTEKTIIEQ